MPPTMTPDFPSFVLPETGFGQWWRVHRYRVKGTAWWFSSSDDPRHETPADIGRFDLPRPNGTCYIAAFAEGAAPESLRATGVEARIAQENWDKRRMSQMSLDRWYGKRIADFTCNAVKWFGAPEDIASLDRAAARPWGEAAHDAGFEGILYRLREDPWHRVGMALFYQAEDHPPDPAYLYEPQPIPVRLRHEVLDLFNGQYRGEQVT